MQETRNQMVSYVGLDDARSNVML